MVAARENQIKNFQPKTYFMLIAETEKNSFQWMQEKTNQTQTFQEEKIDAILKKCQNQPLKITDVKTIVKKQQSPQLYDLTTLQQEANSRFNWSAKENLSILQRLYEH